MTAISNRCATPFARVRQKTRPLFCCPTPTQRAGRTPLRKTGIGRRAGRKRASGGFCGSRTTRVTRVLGRVVDFKPLQQHKGWVQQPTSAQDVPRSQEGHAGSLTTLATRCAPSSTSCHSPTGYPQAQSWQHCTEACCSLRTLPVQRVWRVRAWLRAERPGLYSRARMARRGRRAP